jgi:hypothetical protein
MSPQGGFRTFKPEAPAPVVGLEDTGQSPGPSFDYLIGTQYKPGRNFMANHLRRPIVTLECRWLPDSQA